MMTIDLTQFAIQAIALVGTCAIAWLTKEITTHVRNQAARDVLNAALPRAVGYLQQIGEGVLSSRGLNLPGVPASLAPAVQYMLDHAGEELDRFGISPASVADKIAAEIGQASIAANIAVNGSPSNTVVAPLAPVPVPVTPAT